MYTKLSGPSTATRCKRIAVGQPDERSEAADPRTRRTRSMTATRSMPYDIDRFPVVVSFGRYPWVTMTADAIP